MKYNDSEYAWKNIEKWWNEAHVNPDGSKTKWQPKMKKIWFTEYGFPSMNGCTNEPNVFVDKGSIESKYPRYSNGEVSFLSQKTAMRRNIKKVAKLRNGGENVPLGRGMQGHFLISPIYVTCGADCHNWQTGHLGSGKNFTTYVSDVLSDLLQKVGLKGDQFDTSDVKGLLSGCVINDQQPVRSIIKMLRSCYFFDVVEQNSKLKFIQKGRGVTTEIPIDEIVCNNSLKLIQLSQLDLNNRINIVYFTAIWLSN
ncbi:baseplate megatron protein TIM-barrel domain-containing protein [Wolbachia endosymbiont of Diaphorina citri]|uniref:baseplate megatron protein TIM-barrel domain-containing protein n=1 Tax=Wolbachia endosymbiont of Diaphorina citri TaxID=116598 RepID=UPI002AD37D6F|nr:glycoside hydrolase TIM-barrel-like domain-containing protein [Wolbachia endosymbiont of Diaphorina citri]